MGWKAISRCVKKNVHTTDIMGLLLPHVEMFEIIFSVGKEDPGVGLTLVGKYT